MGLPGLFLRPLGGCGLKGFPIGWCSLGQGYFLVFASPAFLHPASLSSRWNSRWLRPFQGKEALDGQAGPALPPNGGVGLEREAGCCGRSEASPAPPVLFPGIVNPEACPCCSIDLSGNTVEKVAEFRAFFLTWFGPLHSCASGSAPPLVALSACDSPISLGRCCPVGKSPAPPGCSSLLLVWEEGHVSCSVLTGV